MSPLASALGLCLAVVGPMLAFLLRRPILRALTGFVAKVVPFEIVRSTGDGAGAGRCPRCKRPVVYEKVEAGAKAFSCAHCGESGAWS